MKQSWEKGINNTKQNQPKPSKNISDQKKKDRWTNGRRDEQMDRQTETGQNRNIGYEN